MLTRPAGGDRPVPDRTVGGGGQSRSRSGRGATGLTGYAVGVPGIGAGVTVLNKVLAAGGVVLVLVGVMLGFRSVSAGGTDCGSAFQPAGGITPMACDSAVNGSATLVTILIVAGVLCLVASATVKAVRAKAAREKVHA